MKLPQFFLIYPLIAIPLIPVFIYYLREIKHKKNKIQDIRVFMLILCGALIYDSCWWFFARRGYVLREDTFEWMMKPPYASLGKIPLILAVWYLFMVWRKRR